MKKTYELTSEEGVRYATVHGEEPPSVGDEVELEVSADQEKALVAAGWISETKKKKGG